MTPARPTGSDARRSKMPTNGPTGLAANKPAQPAEPRRSQFRCAVYAGFTRRRSSRGVAGIEIVRRLLLPLRRHFRRRELGRATRAAETRLGEIVLARPHIIAFRFG